MAVLPPAGVPVSSIDEAVARMEEIDAALPPADGLRCFNHMYLGVTLNVGEQVTAGFFDDPEFVSHLDVVFANIYLDAVNAVAESDPVPKAWWPLVESRTMTGIEPIQFALAGMNAHINHDLPLAVNETCVDLGTSPSSGSHHADYQKVDELLADAERQIRQSFEAGVVLEADRHAQAVLDLVCSWSMSSARDVAWNTSMALWSLRRSTLARGLLTNALARTTAMASRMLLVDV
ncbi:MAG TPA: DUF5995 family protein [Nocardioidaceae bacterium]|jgi:hypothetical protein